MSASLVLFPSAKPKYVLDTWPVMEWLKNRQPQADRLRGLIESARRGELTLRISIVNVGEVYYSSAKEWGIDRANQILEQMQELPIVFVSIEDGDVLAAARLKAVQRISYADAFAADLAIREDCRLVTGDPDFRALEYAGVLQLEWLGA